MCVYELITVVVTVGENQVTNLTFHYPETAVARKKKNLKSIVRHGHVGTSLLIAVNK